MKAVIAERAWIGGWTPEQYIGKKYAEYLTF
jgi:hypothetical protein